MKFEEDNYEDDFEDDNPPNNNYWYQESFGKDSQFEENPLDESHQPIVNLQEFSNLHVLA